MSELHERYIDEFGSGRPWLSVCCGARPLGHVSEFEGLDPIGICSACRDHAVFQNEDDEEQE